MAFLIMKNKVNFEDLAKGFRRASDIVRMEKPDYIFVPVAGSVPFVDILNIVDRKFRLDSVLYLPNSSRFASREELMQKWYNQFYVSNEIGEPIKILCIDEVLSGSSAVVGYKQFRKSLDERAKKKANGFSQNLEAFEKFKKELNKQIDYRILGIAEKGYERNHEFKRLQANKLVHIVEFDDVPTIDNIALNPLRFKIDRIQPDGKPIYLPEIDRFEITPEYMALLYGIASAIGTDPSSVSPVNLSRIEKGLKQAQL